jgi:hypothetical protein
MRRTNVRRLRWLVPVAAFAAAALLAPRVSTSTMGDSPLSVPDDRARLVACVLPENLEGPPSPSTGVSEATPPGYGGPAPDSLRGPQMSPC